MESERDGMRWDGDLLMTIIKLRNKNTRNKTHLSEYLHNSPEDDDDGFADYNKTSHMAKTWILKTQTEKK